MSPRDHIPVVRALQSGYREIFRLHAPFRRERVTRRDHGGPRADHRLNQFAPCRLRQTARQAARRTRVVLPASSVAPDLRPRGPNRRAPWSAARSATPPSAGGDPSPTARTTAGSSCSTARPWRPCPAARAERSTVLRETTAGRHPRVRAPSSRVGVIAAVFTVGAVMARLDTSLARSTRPTRPTVNAELKGGVTRRARRSDQGGGIRLVAGQWVRCCPREVLRGGSRRPWWPSRPAPRRRSSVRTGPDPPRRRRRPGTAPATRGQSIR